MRTRPGKRRRLPPVAAAARKRAVVARSRDSVLFDVKMMRHVVNWDGGSRTHEAAPGIRPGRERKRPVRRRLRDPEAAISHLRGPIISLRWPVITLWFKMSAPAPAENATTAPTSNLCHSPAAPDPDSILLAADLGSPVVVGNPCFPAAGTRRWVVVGLRRREGFRTWGGPLAGNWRTLALVHRRRVVVVG